MVDSFGDLDWRDRPASSPNSGAILQSRVGKNGDFHVVVPWTDGSLVHWSRDNFRSDMPWSGGTMFGDASYLGTALVETDYTSHPVTTVKNLHAAAVTTDGRVEIWSRECGDQFRWSLLWMLTDTDGNGAPSLSYTGSCFRQGVLDIDLHSHGTGMMLLVYPSKADGLALWWRRNDDAGPAYSWMKSVYLPNEFKATSWAELDPRPITGVSAAMILDRQEALYHSSWKTARSGNGSVSFDDVALTLVFADGGIKVYDTQMLTEGSWDGGYGKDISQVGVFERVELTRPLPDGTFDLTPARGKPCSFQSEYLVDEPSGILPIDQPQVGDLVVMAPARDGGILYWLKNAGSYSDGSTFSQGWSFEYVIGTELYDEVSCTQANFLNASGDHNIEITARRRDLQGFHQYWCDFHGNHGGPVHVLGEVIGTVQQALLRPTNEAPADAKPIATAAAPFDPILTLANMGIDFSVTEADLRDWLGDPAYTPYPALAGALLTLFRVSRLARPVPIDVVRGFYEDAPGAASPRTLADVDQNRLRAAVLAASNERYSESQTDFAKLVVSG
jgi:hypothetical protein